ncbi:MAG: hypothetical protein AAB676_01960 [Verrucomicrobiota bacterium]
MPLLFLLVWLSALSASAQPVPKLTAISQEWLRRGVITEVTLSGENLDSVSSFIVSGEKGVSVAVTPPAQPIVNVESSLGGISSVAAKDNKKVETRFGIATDAALGERELRVVTPAGVSNPINFQVSHLPEVSDNGQNKSVEQAQPVPLPAAINGRINAPSEVDHYRFKAKKGQRLILDVYASRSGSSLDSSLALLDAAGKELLRNEDANGLDSLLDFIVPEDAECVLQIRDFRYQGGGDFRYRLIAGELPYVAAAFPFGGRRGANVEIEIKGQNLGGVSKVLLRLDPSARLGRQEIRATTPLGISNPFPFEVSDLPEFTEQEPNSAIDQADEIKLPTIINGRIQSDKDYDAFTFHADKDQRFIFEVLANRFRSPLDVLLTLTDEIGNVLQRNDDALGADARIEHQFSAAGEYVVIVEDLLERGGEDFGYRLSIRSPQPDFEVTFLPDNPRLQRGGHLPIRCELARLAGFGEMVRVAFADLPPGLHSESLLLTPSGLASGTILLSAAKDAPLGIVPLHLTATSVIAGKPVKRRAEPLSGDRKVKEAFLTVLEPSPFALEPATLMASVEQDQTASIEVIAQRQDGFTGEIKISAEGFSAGREPITRSFDLQPVTLKGTETRGLLNLKARLDSEVGTRLIVLKGETTVNGQTIAQYSSAIPVAVSQVPFVLSTALKRLTVTALPPGTQSAAAETTFTVKAERRAGFNGEIALALDGVPEGVTATIDKILANSAEAIVKLVATDKASAGKEFQLTIRGTGSFNERNYKHSPEQIKLTINAPAEAAEQKVAESKPAESKAADTK